MQKDFWKLSLWVLGFSALFILILLGTSLFTNAKVIDSARSIHAIGILVAICVGGVFAYQRLQIFRTFEPHLTISHKVSHRYIGDRYVHIDVSATLRNSSKVQVELREGFFLLQKVSPVSDEEIEDLYAQVFVDGEYEDIRWPTLERFDRIWEPSELVVEPGEAHPETHEFIVSKDVQTVIIYSYFYDQNFPKKTDHERGWLASTVYDIA